VSLSRLKLSIFLLLTPCAPGIERSPMPARVPHNTAASVLNAE